MADEEITEEGLLAKIEALGPVSEGQRNSVVCTLIGHSRIQTFYFGYYHCARCGHQLGDNLGGYYPGAEKAVVVGHNCDQCRANYAECTWRDKLFVPDLNQRTVVSDLAEDR